jgi:hypothetical protein
MYSAWSGFGAPIKEGFQSQDNLVLSEEKDGFIFKKVGDKNKAMYWMKSLNDYAPISEPSCEINIDNEVIKCPSKFKKKVKKEYESRNNANGNGKANGKAYSTDLDNDLVTESDSEESDSESEDEEENVANTEEQDVSGVSNNQSTSQSIEDESESEDEAIPTEQPNDEDKAIPTEQPSDDDDDVNDDDDDNVPTTALSEPFFGGKIEHFSNNGDERGFLSLHLFLKSIMIACLFYILAHPDSKQFILGKVFKNIKSDNYLYVAMVLFFIVFYVIGIFL